MRPTLFVFTGPESTGKSFLANLTSELFHTSLITEGAREYIDALTRPYVEEDVLKMAKMQYENENSVLVEASHNSIIADTDLLTFKIWSEVKYRKTDEWIDQHLMCLYQPRYYLLCKPDIPWVVDPQRESQYNRQELFDMHIELLDKYKANYTVIEGSFEDRWTQSQKYIEGKMIA